MAYDERLAERVRTALGGQRFTEKRMFGGLCFLLEGNMCCGIVGDKLMVRVGPDRYTAALAEPHTREMDFTGRPLKGMVYVAPAGLGDEAALAGWVGRAVEFTGGLPPKQRKPSRTPKRPH